MINSMTGFSARSGQHAEYSWGWEIRSVNSKGLDIRMRLPEWVEGLEKEVRLAVANAVGRGNVNLTLRVVRDEETAPLNLNATQVSRVMQALNQIETIADQEQLTLIHCTAADVLTQRGVLETATVKQNTDGLKAALLADLPALLADFCAMRAAEGHALNDVLQDQISQVKTLTADAAIAAENRKPQMAKALRENLVRILENADGVDSDRVAQELAMVAVKTDVTEEIDRLSAHVTAAHDLLGKSGPIGRKFDFLMQEFMREANTLCSKSQSVDLTSIGLDLKAVIDQMREQVQNVE